jgi:hypothetical protein
MGLVTEIKRSFMEQLELQLPKGGLCLTLQHQTLSEVIAED